MCEERAGRFIQNVDQTGYMKVQRIISVDGSSGSLREGRNHQGRRCLCDKQIKWREEIEFCCSVEKAFLYHAGVVRVKRCQIGSAEKNRVCSEHQKKNKKRYGIYGCVSTTAISCGIFQDTIH